MPSLTALDQLETYSMCEARALHVAQHFQIVLPPSTRNSVPVAKAERHGDIGFYINLQSDLVARLYPHAGQRGAVGTRHAGDHLW